jgi:hypothetical protein
LEVLVEVEGRGFLGLKNHVLGSIPTEVLTIPTGE